MPLYPKTPRQSRIPSLESREKLLDFAVDALVEPDAPRLDLLQFSMEAVIEGAGVSRSAAYKEFNSLNSFRQAVLNKVTEGDIYSQQVLESTTASLLGESLKSNLERPPVLMRFGVAVAQTAFY